MPVIEELEKVLDHSRISINESILEQHGQDESYHRHANPLVVVYPKTAKEVSEIVTIAKKHEQAITPFGVGSSLEGHVIPYEGGITVDFSLMNRIIEIRPEDFLVRVQPGVTREALNKELKKYGLFFPVDPGANASLGGMVATNASGTTSVRYGIMRDQVRNLEVVLPDSSIIQTGNLAAKSSSGYHLNGLFVGSEGTLGLFTELTLRVHGIPEHILAGRATFNRMDDAVTSVQLLLQAGIELARVELVDEQSIIQVNKARQTNYDVAPTLFVELHGHKAALQESTQIMKDLLEEKNVEEIKFERDHAARNQLWEARHYVAYAYSNAYPGKDLMVTDVCVPFSELANAVISARKELEELGLDGGIVGHVGDGNYHVLLMIDLDDPEEINKANDFTERIVQYALDRGGTCTGEHGVGVGKVKYQRREHGKAYDMMRKIKNAIDPDNLFNPGKIID